VSGGYGAIRNGHPASIYRFITDIDRYEEKGHSPLGPKKFREFIKSLMEKTGDNHEISRRRIKTHKKEEHSS
jgi:hypothetical protein